MIKIVTPTVLFKSVFVWGRVSRLVTVVLMLSGLAACAVAPTEPADSGAAERVESSAGIAAAIDMYNADNFPGAIEEYDNIISHEGSSASDQRLAHLGKAMVYLGNDENWHSMENAKMSLIAAGQVVPGSDGEFTAETDLLMDALSAAIGTESKYVALQAKSGNSGTEVKRLRQENATLKEQRDELLAEQKRLNEALETLKQLTLGN